MLNFSIHRVLRMRDIERPYRFLIENGFTHMTAVNFLKNAVRAPKVAHVERLCRLLKCTPNDFYEWIPEAGDKAIAENHPLNALNRETSSGLNKLIKEIPLERLGEVEEFLKEMKNE